MGVPISNPPAQSALDAALADATRADLVVRGERARVLGPEDVRAFGRALRIAPGAPRWMRDLPGNIEVWPWGGDDDFGLVIVNPDLTVRWVDWSGACDLVDPAALGAWLAEHGCPEPLADLELRRSAAAKDRRSRYLALAPPAVRPWIAEMEEDPYAFEISKYREAFDALGEALGGDDRAVWAACAWHGAVPGPWTRTLLVERMAEGLLRSLGVEEVIAIAARGVPEEARAGLCRFLTDHARTRFWALPSRLTETERDALVRAAAATGEPGNELRTRQVLFDEGPLAPEGTRLLAAAQNGALRRLCTDGRRAFALDLQEIRRIDPDGQTHDLATVYRPDTPLAVRGKHVWFRNPVQPHSVPGGGGDVRERSAPLSSLREVRFPWSYRRFREACDRAVARALPFADPALVLDVDHDQRDAYMAFGGDLPAALASSYFWVADPRDNRLLRVTRSGESRAIPLDGVPRAIGAQGNHIHVVIERGDSAAAIVVLRPDLSLRRSHPCSARPQDIRGVLLVGDEVWLRLSAPLGDVLVALPFDGA